MCNRKTMWIGAALWMPAIFMLPQKITAQSSANYSLERSVVDAGGGAAGSAHYGVKSAAGQSGAVGTASSVNVLQEAGFFAAAVIPTAVEERQPSGKPGRFALHQNYPNPFNPVTTIRFEVMDACRVTLTICDMLGRRSALLVDAPYAPGEYDVTFDASDVPSGVYFYRIRMGSFSAVRKMVLLE